MKGICHECGCEFDMELPGNITICPECATDHIRQMEEFLQEYYENLDKYRALDQEFLQNMAWEDYLYSNTYPVFMKLMNTKREGEALSECVNRSLTEAGISPGAFFSMDYRSARKIFNGENGICYKYLCEEIKNIFLNGHSRILEETPEGLVQLYEVSYRGYCYAFVVDKHQGKQVVILTDFYRSWERGREDILMTSTNGESFVEINDSVNYRPYLGGRYLIINTYNVFCKYAKYLRRERDLGFNKTLFDDAVCELDCVFNEKGDVNALQAVQKFPFVVFRNIIIIYRFQECACGSRGREIR